MNTYLFVNYMQSTVNNYSTSATGYTMTDSQRGENAAIILSNPASTTEVISYTMGKPIKTRELHYMIWTILCISRFYYQALICNNNYANSVSQKTNTNSEYL